MVDEVRALYTRCKALGLAVGAGLALGEHDPHLREQAADLEAEAAKAHAEPRFADAIRACGEAAAALRRLLDDDAAEHLDDARRTQRAMRRAVWHVLDCDYEPCGAPAQPVRGGR